jgi:glutamate synthase (ferredoxin)
MSGGTAYVYDEAGDFATRCNMEMVALERLEDAEDLDFVRGLMERHVEYTDSDVAKALLSRWPKVAELFVKVMPLDYRRVLEEQRRAGEAQPSGAGDAMRAARG